MNFPTPPRKQHYLPQFFLRRFSMDGEGIYQVRKSDGRIAGVKIKDTAAIRNFHTLDGDGVPDPYALERALAIVESDLANHLDDFLSGSFHVPRVQDHVVQLLAMLRMRVPAVREHIQRSGTAHITTRLLQLEQAGKLPDLPIKLANILQEESLVVEVTNQFCMEQIFRLAGDQGILDALGRMRMTLLHAPFGARFITSDQPVAIFHADANDGIGIGPETEGVVISLALSSRSALLLERRSGPHIERAAKQAEVDEINRRTAKLATDYIFTGEFAEGLLPLIDSVRGDPIGFVFEKKSTKDAQGFLLRYLGVGPVRAA